ncbi:MAG: 3'-5' exonuclease domain-containing protein 2 [Desulfovibrio sp.]|jgi:ribonuclease D|nr:3'-5' exonuclease domain-containing protein 2 [Desulfovibrio sp.]
MLPETGQGSHGGGRGQAKARLSREAINALPLFRYEGKVSLVHTDQELNRALERLNSGAALGFDTETPPSFRKGQSNNPSLIQLALEDEVFLFHFKWRPPDPELAALLGNPAVVKTGVAVHDDMRFLQAVFPFSPGAVVDLGEVARRNNVEAHGLRGLAALFLGLRISKIEHCSDWGKRGLSIKQIRYAATDAWISRALYFKMLEAGLDFS